MLIMLAVAFVLAQAPPLDEIAVSGTVADLKAAIGSGADPNQKDSDGVTPLMRAASAGRGDIVAALLTAGADAKARTSGGVDALMMASLGGYTEAARALLAAKMDANARDNQGRTALMAAASSGEQPVVDALLAAGADVNVVDAGGASPLTYASAEGFEGAVVAFQKHGARPGDRELMLAAARCHTGIVRGFLASGLSVNPKDAGTTPLIVASGGNCVDTVTLLLDRGAALDAKDSDGWTALIKASAAGHAEVVRLLLAKGADMSATDSTGRSAWSYAALARRDDLADMFRQARAAANPPVALTVSSSALRANEPMSREYTADGHNYSPPLAWSSLPEHTVSVALVCEDPDAGNPPPFVHWVIYNIPSTATGLPENIPFSPDTPMPAAISGAVQGMSGFRRPIYRGPAPPPGKPHHYHFVVYALDVGDLPAGLSRAELLDAIKGHVLGQGELVATYERKP
jgi:Raf kinase inhibitor-like YbhB/YbcL family protein